MAPEDFNVRPGEVKTIACPDCRSWRRIMGETILKIREHCISDRLAQGETHVLCPGSDQLVIVDIDLRRWQVLQDRLLRDAMPQDNRRAARQFYKPIPAPAAPVARMQVEVTLDATRQAYLAHHKNCAGCVDVDADGAKRIKRCPDGVLLARRYLLALQQEPARRKAREQQQREERRSARELSRRWPAGRRRQWVTRGGEMVETANNQCRPQPQKTVSVFRGPQVPQTPLHPRQAELGRDQLITTGLLECARCDAREVSLESAAAAGWQRVRRDLHCVPCSGRFPQWMRASI
ncbi:hypothetical protein [Streptomyces sp. SGAir0957]